VPVARDPQIDLDSWLVTALDLDPLRQRAVAATRRG
jgi:hypothetical protein